MNNMPICHTCYTYSKNSQYEMVKMGKNGNHAQNNEKTLQGYVPVCCSFTSSTTQFNYVIFYSVNSMKSMAYMSHPLIRRLQITNRKPAITHTWDVMEP